MDDIYREIYATLYYTAYSQQTLYMVPQPFYPFNLAAVATVRRIIDEAELELVARNRVRLRPDAKYLLLMNFIEMIGRPLTMANRFDTETVANLVRSDINLMVSDATERRGETAEVSGHGIIDALSRNWKRLKVLEFKVWE